MTDLNQVESEIRDLDVETNEVVEETLEEANLLLLRERCKGKSTS